jgi:hypothetical protein
MKATTQWMTDTVIGQQPISRTAPQLAHWLADEEVSEALAERDRSRRALSFVFEALSRLSLLHGRHQTKPLSVALTEFQICK